MSDAVIVGSCRRREQRPHQLAECSDSNRAEQRPRTIAMSERRVQRYLAGLVSGVESGATLW
jgi:hypothetical protein